MDALLIGRFHAVTKAQDAWLQSLRNAPVDKVICVVTSANHAGTRRNPLDVATRVGLLRPALERTGKPFAVVEVDDVPTDWVAHVVDEVGKQTGRAPTPAEVSIYGSNRDVDQLFTQKGFTVVSHAVKGLTPHELVKKIAAGGSWEDDASPETRALVRAGEGAHDAAAHFFAVAGERRRRARAPARFLVVRDADGCVAAAEAR